VLAFPHALEETRKAAMKRTLIVATTLAVAGLVLGSVAIFGVRTSANPTAANPTAADRTASANPTPTAEIVPVWTEAKWPFPMDQWGLGKAFVCLAADCGGQVDLYVRPKIGFCNCATGVSDETELERVADTELLRAKTKSVGAGRPIKVGWMRGLSRSYLATDGETGERLVSVAYNDECDVVVAVARFANGDPAALEPAILAFLNTNPMVLWAKKELGLEFIRREW
jgi:hypothetical protein